MLRELKNVQANLDSGSLDEHVALLAFGKTMKAEFEGMSMPVPGWLDESLTSLQHEVHARLRDSLVKAEKETLAALDGLRTATERKADLNRKLTEIQKRLGKA